MKLDLLDNAMDSITHGLEHYAKGALDPRNYKFAILHVAQGIELVLKERLAREHRVLVFEKVERATLTVGFDGAVERLQSICNIDLGKYLPGLRKLKDVRNEIEHYKVTVSRDEAVALIGKNVPFLLRFLKEELGTNLQEILDEDVWRELLAIQDVYSLAKEQADEKVAPLRWREREGSDIWLKVCPSCGEEYLVLSEDSEKLAECLLCNHLSPLEECWKCSQLFPIDDWFAEGGLCAVCTDYLKQPYT